jgi:alpha-D-ribose 1-methylphosphonate 5-triphosphate synthase subunit PhnG
MEDADEKYLEKKLELIRAVVTGSVLGAHIFGGEGKALSIGEMTRHAADKAMEQIEKDVRQIWKHARRKR